MNSKQKNALALAAIMNVLSEGKNSPNDYIKNYDPIVTKEVAQTMDTWDCNENMVRDFKVLANEYYRRIKK